LSLAERAAVADALPGEVTYDEMAMPEGERHFEAKIRALDALWGYFRRQRRRRPRRRTRGPRRRTSGPRRSGNEPRRRSKRSRACAKNLPAARGEVEPTTAFSLAIV